ncbi:uncharacterized protein LDX57_011897 [Aspergillus melleus]|uniref:uncharacterized protein n=1 Tax=Aspergillus melleus TaxID=138277 RepID=UPI001E8E984F|nr:uncharacterized protein LDX57_011897 [Aspergillus melleus]KAH8434259.1 hypothetical protein LDX57_011897 [Aspergillus melleus]
MKNGQMKESCTGVADLEDVQPDIFVAFCEFAYHGTYNTPSLVDEPDDEKGQLLDICNSNPPCSLRTGGYYNSCARSSMEICFGRLKYQTQPVPTTHSPDLLFHAELYVFATKYLVEPLRQLCVSSLYRDLVAAREQKKPVRLILDLLAYTYAHTSTVEPAGVSPLRELVTLFVAGNANLLYQEERFKEILRDNSEFGLVLIQLLCQV